MGMCTSPYLDVQREGLLRLTHILPECEKRVQCPVNMLINLLTSKDQCVRRLAVSGLVASQQTAFSPDQLEILIALVGNSLELMETRKESLVVLVKAIAQDKESRSSVSSIMRNKDTSLICSEVSLSPLVAEFTRILKESS